MKKFFTLLALLFSSLQANISHPSYPCDPCTLRLPTEWTYPIQISWISPIQTIGVRDSVRGFRLNILYGESHHVSGLDIGFVNYAYGNLNGIELGVSNVVEGDAGVFQVGLYNSVYYTFSGLQIALCNYVELFTTGIQIGIANYSGAVKGVQIGLLNITYQLEGVQIGLVNIYKCSPCCNVMPFINVGW
jgi:hypothetical protein